MSRCWYVWPVTSSRGDSGTDEERERRNADTEMVFAYHEEQLRTLQEHVREGFARFDSGEINSFELDHLIYQYSRSAKELWKFCGNGESRIAWAVAAIESRRQSGSELDWWDSGDPERRR